MRFILLSLCVSTLLIQADEIERIESIVEDITQLRQQYKECQDTLTQKLSKNTLVQELYRELENLKEKNNILQNNLEKQISRHREFEKSNIFLQNKLKEQEERLTTVQQEYGVSLKEKESKIISLENQINSLKKTDKIILKKTIKEQLPPTVCIDPNPFPKLVKKQKQKKTNSSITFKEESTPASVYRIKSQGNVYNSVKGDIVDIWEVNRSFTSNVKFQDWIKITGYFIEQKWQRAEESLWIPKSDTKKRD